MKHQDRKGSELLESAQINFLTMHLCGSDLIYNFTTHGIQRHHAYFTSVLLSRRDQKDLIIDSNL